VNELEDNIRIVSFVKLPMLVGIVPWRHVDSIYNDCRLFSCPIVVGRAPLKPTKDIYRVIKFVIEPMVVGMGPIE
jgi:hypothetical protein